MSPRRRRLPSRSSPVHSRLGPAFRRRHRRCAGGRPDSAGTTAGGAIASTACSGTLDHALTPFSVVASDGAWSLAGPAGANRWPSVMSAAGARPRGRSWQTRQLLVDARRATSSRERESPVPADAREASRAGENIRQEHHLAAPLADHGADPLPQEDWPSPSSERHVRVKCKVHRPLHLNARCTDACSKFLCKPSHKAPAPLHCDQVTHGYRMGDGGPAQRLRLMPDSEPQPDA